jgi:purine-binding chemotaxis protein CheW
MEIKSNNNKSAYLSFRLGNELFAVSVDKVLEVLQRQTITKVPKTPDHITGVINFRGEILPVLELRRKFNLPDRPENLKYVIIVFEFKHNHQTVILGSIADGVKDVIEISDNEIKPVPVMGANYDVSFIKGMIRKDDRFIMILDIDNVFSITDVFDVAAITMVEHIEEDL